MTEKGSTENDLDAYLSKYTESLSLYLTCHAENEFSDQQEYKFIKNHGDALKLRANQMHKMSTRFSDGKIGPDEIQFLYSIKVSMESEAKDCSRLLDYIERKKQDL